MDNRIERVVFETDRYRVTGSLNLPREGYRSRLSDYLNRSDANFVPLTDVQIVPIGGGEAVHRPFVTVSRSQIHVAYPLDGDDQA